ncbi:DMT family transporter [Polycladomyces subterraneus]|uniref:DMT family transporter n=1 Tax=Polycladomyces subterraneus TaxID=1016997 RepID=A0ABT8IPT3_9BACL|nr:DMT family transporter [Polycladomyces subterraneus]MDN4594733.1 DMT family transporter [Polycladomyces subterraneus]
MDESMESKALPAPIRVLLLAVGVVAVSFSAIFIKWSDAPAGVLGMNRLLITMVLMLPWVWKRRGEWTTLSRQEWGWLILSGVFLGLHFWGWISSFHYTSVASSMVLLNTAPLFTAMGAFLAFRQRFGRVALSGMGLALAGSVMVAGADLQVGRTAWIGDLLSAFGALSVAIHMLIGEQLRNKLSSTVYSFSVFGVASLLLMAMNLADGVPLFDWPSREWGIFLLLSLAPTVFGHVLFNWLLKFVGAVTIQTAILGEPVGAILLALWLLGEPVTTVQILGCALTIGGIAWYLREQADRAASGGKRLTDQRSV